MARLTKSEWDSICEEYRRGTSRGALITKYGIRSSTLYSQREKRGIASHSRTLDSWEYRRIAKLMDLREHKFSFAKIAKRDGVSRNAVAGMVFRLRNAGAL